MKEINCVDCQDVLGLSGPNGNSFRCYGDAGGYELKRDICNGNRLPIDSPDWCPKKKQAGEEMSRDWNEDKKAYPHPYDGDSYTVKLMLDAIAEIEQLRAENARQRRLLEMWTPYVRKEEADQRRAGIEQMGQLRREKAELVKACWELVEALALAHPINPEEPCFVYEVWEKRMAVIAKLEGGAPNAKP